MEYQHEQSRLSKREEALLAELESRIAATDPELSRQFNGDGPPAVPITQRRWFGATLTVVGATIMLITFTVNAWLAVAGVGLMAAGLAFLVAHWAPLAFRRGGGGSSPDGRDEMRF